MKTQIIDFSFTNKNIKEVTKKSDNFFDSNFSLKDEKIRGDENSIEIVCNRNFSVQSEEENEEEIKKEEVSEICTLQHQTAGVGFLLPELNISDTSGGESLLKKVAEASNPVSLQELGDQVRKNNLDDKLIPIDKNYIEYLSEDINIQLDDINPTNEELNNLIQDLDSSLSSVKNFRHEGEDVVSDVYGRKNLNSEDSNFSIINETEYEESRSDTDSNANDEVLKTFHAMYNTQTVSRNHTVVNFGVESNLSLNIEKLIKIIENGVANNVKEVNIQLEPESLGKVTLKFLRTAEGVNVKINVQDNNARNLLLGDLQDLSRSLSEKRLSVSMVEVNVGQQLSGDYKDGHGRNSHSGSQKDNNKNENGDFKLFSGTLKNVISE